MKPDETIRDTCRRCRKPMAAQKDAMCCSCRYGQGAPDDHSGHVIDLVEWMATRVGYRLAAVGAFDLWAEDPAARNAGPLRR